MEEMLTKDEIREGFRLACQARVKRNPSVTIPRESRIIARKMQLFGIERTYTKRYKTSRKSLSRFPGIM